MAYLARASSVPAWGQAVEQPTNEEAELRTARPHSAQVQHNGACSHAVPACIEAQRPSMLLLADNAYSEQLAHTFSIHAQFLKQHGLGSMVYEVLQ